MDFKKTTSPITTVTRDMSRFDETGNVYEALAIIAKRANQISVEMKQELNRKLEDFSSYSDTLEEVFENKEQIEISRFYEKLPKASLIATQEFLEHKLHYRKTGEAVK